MKALRLKLREAIEKHQAQFPPDKAPNHLRIAADVGISTNTMSRYMNDKVARPDLAVLARFCDYLGIDDLNDLFELVELEETGD